MDVSSKNPENNQIINYLKKLEARISRIEAHLNLEQVTEEPEIEQKQPVPPKTPETADALEFRIGEYWLAKVGIVALAIGIAFLMTLPYQNLPPVLPSLFGYLLMGGILTLSHYWRNTFTYISRYLLGGALVLFYFTTLRLHFFSAQPAVTSRTLELILLLAVVSVNLYISARRKSVYLVSLSLAMGYTTAIVSDQAYFLFAVVTLMSSLVVYFKLKYQWPSLIIYGIILTYFTHFVWFLNNPFLGNELQLVSSPQINLFFILVYALIFAAGNLFRGENIPEDERVIVSTFLNSAGCYGLFLLLTITTFQAHLALFHVFAALLFLALSIVFWIRETSKYSTFFYAMLGYSALSVAIIAQFARPDFFIWLSWQSIVVVTTAIWFRSKFIIVANFIIYIIIFIAYLFMAGTVSTVGLSFGVVALISARILNWQKDRLELKTEQMRNSYLVAAFFMFPYALYHLVPGGYVSLSWVGVTIFYYIMSRILDNKKYRWMALGTLLLTVGRVFIIDMTFLEPAYRVVSFLVLGFVLIIISILYTRMRSKSVSDEANEEKAT